MNAVEDLKAKVKSFEGVEPFDKQEVLDLLRGIVTKKKVAQMDIREVVEVLILVADVPEVTALMEAGGRLTFGELTRKKREYKSAAA